MSFWGRRGGDLGRILGKRSVRGLCGKLGKGVEK